MGEGIVVRARVANESRPPRSPAPQQACPSGRCVGGGAGRNTRGFRCCHPCCGRGGARERRTAGSARRRDLGSSSGDSMGRGLTRGSANRNIGRNIGTSAGSVCVCAGYRSHDVRVYARYRDRNAGRNSGTGLGSSKRGSRSRRLEGSARTLEVQSAALAGRGKEEAPSVKSLGYPLGEARVARPPAHDSRRSCLCRLRSHGAPAGRRLDARQRQVRVASRAPRRRQWGAHLGVEMPALLVALPHEPRAAARVTTRAREGAATARREARSEKREREREREARTRARTRREKKRCRRGRYHVPDAPSAWALPVRGSLDAI